MLKSWILCYLGSGLGLVGIALNGEAYVNKLRKAINTCRSNGASEPLIAVALAYGVYKNALLWPTWAFKTGAKR